ncbi:6005_t:CDS:10, partial [Acaulospora morrowiae]
LRQYDVGEQVASAGLWKIYAGIKKTTGQKVAIFMFEKKFIDNTLRKGYERKENEKVYQVLKREATQLSRLRHPSVLEVVEAVEESRTVITFATEPILASLSNLLGNYDNLSPIPEDIKNFELDELEIQKGLLQVGKGLQFCHNDAKIVHSNLVPEAIFVNVKGDWKIGGFGFSNFFNPDTPVPYEYPDYDARIPCYAQKNYDYMAPEYVLDENFEVANDMFALGCLIYTVHSKGKPPMENHNSIHNYRKNVEQLSSIKYDHLPYHLHEVMFHLITRYPSQRMTASEFQTSKYFDNILVSTVKFFESFPEKSKDDKANFMKGLIRILPQFPERVLLRKILPCLLQEIKDHGLLPFTLPNIFFIAQKLPPLDFSEKVLIPLKPVFTVPEPMQNMILCLDKIELFQQKTSLSAFKEDVMPLIYNALETKTPAIQDKVLRVIPTIIDSLDLLTIKSSLFPRIQNLFVHTTILSIKVTTLVCLNSLVKSLDNFTMTEKLIPLLKGIKTKEPSVMITTLSVYEEMGKNVEKDIMATEILPQLWKMSIVPTLNIDQFQKFMQVIKVMSMKVEEEHSKQLQDIKQIDETVKNIEGGN